jgi:hypothetical protein
MWTFVLGMILSPLPRHWRAGERVGDLLIPWRAAATASGFLQAILAVVGLVWWYSISVTTWAAKELDSALQNGPAAQLPGQAIGFSALLLWSIHPCTWLIAYFAVEGLIRMLAAAFAGQVVATLPLAIVDWCYGKATGRALEGDALHVPSGKEQLRSFVTAVREQVWMARSPEVEDELFENVVGAESFLEIRASRRKSEWLAPRIVRIGDRYFRLDESLHGKPPRAFVYRLRKLTAGVPGRTVIVYEPPSADARTISKKNGDQ